MIGVVRALTSAVAVAAAAIACLAPAASADHTLSDLVSPDGGAPYDWFPLHMSQDAQRVLLGTTEPRDPADTDTRSDIYERSGETFTRVARDAGDYSQPHVFSQDGAHVFYQTLGDTQVLPEDRDLTRDVYEAHAGVTRLVSVGDFPSNGLFNATVRDASADGSRVYFTTQEQLVAQDTDGGYIDIYERSSSGTRLVTTGGNGPFDVTFYKASDAGAVTIFGTAEQLVGSDTDTQEDIYVNSPSGTEFFTDGAGASVHAMSPTGSRIVFSTFAKLVPQDTDSRRDLYAREGGTNELLSIGPTGGNAAIDVGFESASRDATKVVFYTLEHLTTDHTWTGINSYGWYRRAGTTTDLIIPVAQTQPPFPRSSGDGSRVFYTSFQQMHPDDTDGFRDVYQWRAGVTTLVSTGPQPNAAGGSLLAGASFDGERVFFTSSAPLVPEDTSADWDVYERFQGQTALLTDNAVPQVGPGIGVQAVSDDGTNVLLITGQSLDPADTDGGAQDAYLYSAPSPLASLWRVERADDFTGSAP